MDVQEIIRKKWETLERYEEDFLNDEFDDDTEAIKQMINERETPISFPIEDYIDKEDINRSAIRHTKEYSDSFLSCLFFYAGQMLDEETYDDMNKNVQYRLFGIKNYILDNIGPFDQAITGIEQMLGDDVAKTIDNEKLSEDDAYKRTYIIDVLCREYTSDYIEKYFDHRPEYKEIEQYYYYFVLVVAIMYELEYRIVRPVIDIAYGVNND